MSWNNNSWLKEAEHLRDRGRTWGPGVDDVVELTPEEEKRQADLMAAYRQKLKDYSVTPRKVFADAGEALRSDPSPSSSDGYALISWQQKHSDANLALCKSAAESLGYSLNLGWVKDHADANRERDLFSVSIDYYGYLPDRGGNIHRFFVCGIEDVEDCLQLVADFAAIGAQPTTWYGGNFHYSSGHTGELRNELIRRYNIGKPAEETPLDDRLEDAKERAVEGKQGEKEEREFF